MRIPPLLFEYLRKGRASGAAFEPARLIIETLQCGKLLLTAEPGLGNRRFQNSDRLVVDRDRHWEGMPVLAAMSHRKPRRVGKPVGCAMDDLGDHRQRPHRPGADTRGQQQIGKILWASIRRRGQLDLLSSLGPDRIVGEVRRLSAAGDASAAAQPDQPVLPHLVMPAHHDVRAGDVNIGRLHATLATAADVGPTDFAGLLLTPGVGARTVRSLAMVAEIVHGAPYRFADPARFSFAHGGKDSHPFPVPIAVYDQTIRVLKTAVAKARLGREEELAALKRLDDQARRLERHATGPTFAQLVDQERRDSHAHGGRSVFGWEPPPRRGVSG